MSWIVAAHKNLYFSLSDYLVDSSLAFSWLFHQTLNSFNQSTNNDIQKDTFHLIPYLQEYRCLLILDGLDAVLSNSELTKFIQQLSLHPHQSCMITTSREKQDPLEVNTKTVCSLTLNGLAKIDF